VHNKGECEHATAVLVVDPQGKQLKLLPMHLNRKTACENVSELN